MGRKLQKIDSDRDDDEDKNEEDEKMNAEKEEKEEMDKKMKKNRHKIKKMDPFKKSLEKAKLAKEEKESKVLGHEQNEIERQIKLKRRKKQTKLLQQRTSRGQPIMKHVINNILYKLEKQNQQTQEDLTQTKKTSTSMSTSPATRHHSSKF